MQTTKKTRWSDEEIQYLTENYGLIKSREIGLTLNRSMDSVQLKARRLGLKLESKYSFNKGFFKKIDTHQKAYWLGFIYADGYVVHNKETRNYELGIMLKGSDFEHLKKFNKDINGNLEVKKRNKKVYYKNVDRTVESEMCEIRVYSKEMVEDLISLGVTPNKTYKLMSLPNLNDDLKWSFIRGFLDGDGHISISKQFKSRSTIGFTSICEPFLLEIKQFLDKFGVDSNIRLSKKPTDNLKPLYQLIINKNQSKKIFLEKCYENNLVYLNRKFDKQILLSNAL